MSEPTAKFDPTNVVVDREHADLVASMLPAEQGVRWSGGKDVSPRLGLVRLHGIQVPETYAGHAIATYGADPTLRLDLPTPEEWRNSLGVAADDEDKKDKYYQFDVLMAVLRAKLRKRYGNWNPVMGKGRMTVIGTPQSKSSKDPRPCGPPPRRARGLGRGVRVATLDTPIIEHPDLPETHVSASGMYRGAEDHPKRAGHGTFVAGLIRAHASEAHIRAVGVLDSADGTATAWQVAHAIVELADSDFDIVNLSLGARTLDGEVPLLFTRALQRLGSDTLVVASAGNRGGADDKARMLPVWPAAQAEVIAVGSWDNGLTPNVPWVTCEAAGDLVSAFLTGKVVMEDPDGVIEFPQGYAEWGGSSFATADVTGRVAARVVPGRVTARQAFEELLDAPNSGIRTHVAR